MSKILRAGEGKRLRALEALVAPIGALEAEMAALDDDALAAKTGEFRQRLDRGATLDDLLVDAFAVVREMSKRELGQRHYDVQLMGGAALHFGWVAEMRTGEGKTLVATLAAYLGALEGRGVHVVTANDYLASRDADEMGRVYRRLGLSVGLVVPGPVDSVSRRAAYAADITYGTANEFGFDYLRDNMAGDASLRVGRGQRFCIVDEIDSILIDEARTPLLIAGPAPESSELYRRFADIVERLVDGEHYEVDEAKRQVAPTDAGIEVVEAALGVDTIYGTDTSHVELAHHLAVALQAKALYRRDRDYVVADGEVLIVDEFTGRVLPGRRWSHGLHQAVEAKESVAVAAENHTLATVTIQNYFRLYDRLAGMTGTAQSDAAELHSTYGLEVVPIPTHRPSRRVDHDDVVFMTLDAKLDAVAADIAARHAAGQPVLAGTASVEASERLSRRLDVAGVPHRVLNAKEHTSEADVVAQAGRRGAVTVATNMAGRGVDILLGGNPAGLARLSLADVGVDPDDPANVEQLAAAVDEWRARCAAEADEVRELGGLYVVGTERHESRRIDNQLRGRSGRQGDPGESRFYVSFDDDLMRLFATGALERVLRASLDPDQPLESKMVTRAVERAQRTVEGRNAEMRADVVKYDEVLDAQRKVIYARRDQVLDGADVAAEIAGYVGDVVDAIVEVATDDDGWVDPDVAAREFRGVFAVEAPPLGDCDADAAREALGAAAREAYAAREAEFDDELMRDVERQVLLAVLDARWREHLAEMDVLRDGIGWRAIVNTEPIVAWRREGFDMFAAMLRGVAFDVVANVMHANVVVLDA